MKYALIFFACFGTLFVGAMAGLAIDSVVREVTHHTPSDYLAGFCAAALWYGFVRPVVDARIAAMERQVAP